MGALTNGMWRAVRVGILLSEVMARAASDAGAGWNGLALTTRGARAVTGVSADRLSASDGDVDTATVFELRLWTTADEAWAARELRWLNGAGGVEVTVWEASSNSQEAADPDAAPCLVRSGAYLQHAPAGRGPSKEMGMVEVFRTEEEYGNVVFADELMTGRWS